MLNMGLLLALDFPEIRSHFKCKCHCGLSIVDFEMIECLNAIAVELQQDHDDDDYMIEMVQATACYQMWSAHTNYHAGHRIKFKLFLSGELVDPSQVLERIKKLDIPVAQLKDCLIIDITKGEKHACKRKPGFTNAQLVSAWS